MPEQRSKQWFEDRKYRVTGSKIGAILGLSPFAGPKDVMRDMVRDYHGAEKEFKGNVATEHGTINEPNALKDYEMETGNEVVEAYFEVHPDFDWLGASPDGYLGEEGLLEIKCPYGKRHSKDDDFKSLSEQPHYYGQIQIQLLCTGRKWCDFYQWSPYGSKLERVNIDPQWIDENMPVLQEFYEEYLEQRKSENAWRYLDGGNLVQAYKQAKAALEVAKDELEEAKQALIDATNGEGGKVGDLNITKAKKKGSISYAKAVGELLPDANLEKYRGKSSEYWVIK